MLVEEEVNVQHATISKPRDIFCFTAMTKLDCNVRALLVSETRYKISTIGLPCLVGSIALDFVFVLP